MKKDEHREYTVWLEKDGKVIGDGMYRRRMLSDVLQGIGKTTGVWTGESDGTGGSILWGVGKSRYPG